MYPRICRRQLVEKQHFVSLLFFLFQLEDFPALCFTALTMYLVFWHYWGTCNECADGCLPQQVTSRGTVLKTAAAGRVQRTVDDVVFLRLTIRLCWIDLMRLVLMHHCNTTCLVVCQDRLRHSETELLSFLALTCFFSLLHTFSNNVCFSLL